MLATLVAACGLAAETIAAKTLLGLFTFTAHPVSERARTWESTMLLGCCKEELQ